MSAPVSQSSPHSTAVADDVVCQRVRECTVHLHGCVQKWNELNSQGFDIANKLVNTCLETKYVQEHATFGAVKEVKGLPESLEYKIVTEREKFLKELKCIGNELSQIVDRMGSLSSNFRSAVDLVLSKGLDPSQPLFQTLPTSCFGVYSEELYQAYSEELSLRQSIISDILRQTNRDTLTVYLSCWLHQPYIKDYISDQLEAMVIECGLRTST